MYVVVLLSGSDFDTTLPELSYVHLVVAVMGVPLPGGVYPGRVCDTLLPLASYATVVTLPFASSCSVSSPKVSYPLIVTGCACTAEEPYTSEEIVGATVTARCPASS